MFPLRHPLASLNLRSLILGLPSLLVGLLVVGLLVVLSNEFLWVEYIFTFIMYSFFAFLLIGISYYPTISIIKHFTSRKEFRQIDFNRCNAREYLSKILPKLNRYYKRKLLQYLEANVKNVTGHWENETILKIDDSDETSRLAKLEEKWLGLNR